MRNYIRLIAILLYSLSTMIMGQKAGYECRLSNDALISDRSYEFDIILKNSGTAPLEIASLQFGIQYDSLIINNGTLGFSYVTGTSGLHAAQVPAATSLLQNAGKYVMRIAPRANPGAGKGTMIPAGKEVSIGRFRLQNTVPFNGHVAALRWSFTTTQYNTVISAYVDGLAKNITNRQAHGTAGLTASKVTIELSQLTAAIADRDVTISWKTDNQSGMKAFEIERQPTGEQTSWVTVGSVSANDNAVAVQSYSFIDRKLNTGSYQYRIKVAGADGSVRYSKTIETGIALPKHYSISNNYPNPFNPSTKIDYQIPSEGIVNIEVFSTAGEKMGTLVNNEHLPAGYYSVELTSSNMQLATGVYIYRITVTSKSDKGFSKANKMLLIK